MDKKYHINYSYVRNPVPYGETDLVQIGRLYCMPETVITKHAHINWYELTIITDGEGLVITNDIEKKVTKGDIYFSCPGDFHEIRSSKENPLHYDFFSFNTRNQAAKKQLHRIVSEMQDIDNRIFADEQISSIISQAISEMSEKQVFSEDILSAMFSQVIFRIMRNFHSKKPQQKKHNLSADTLCFQIMHYIDTHIYSIENLNVLSEKFSYNYSYLSDVFKKTTGNTIGNYYQSRRLDASRLLIREQKFKINQIAERLGYSSLYAFSNAFKKRYGISPRNYLNGLNEEKQNIN